MKKWITYLLLSFLLLGGYKAGAQANEIQQLALNIQKLTQFRKILRNMYTSYQIIRGGYDKVKDITSGNYSLHEGFLDGLMAVSPAVRNYRRVGDIITNQSQIIKEYRRAFAYFKQSGVFNVQEIAYMGTVYDNLLEKSLVNLNELTMVITASSMRMSDDERLTAIDRLASDVDQQLSFLRSFNNSTGVLTSQRKRAQQEIKAVEKMYNLKQ
jgi:hypothetical protein